MSDLGTRDAQRIAAINKFRHIDEVPVAEREQVLVDLVELLPETEAELADQMLYMHREKRRLHKELMLLLDAQRAMEAKN